MSNQNPSANPQVQNPELGLGDALKFFQAVAEAVLTGASEVPKLTLRVAGKTVDIGPAPVAIR